MTKRKGPDSLESSPGATGSRKQGERVFGTLVLGFGSSGTLMFWDSRVRNTWGPGDNYCTKVRCTDSRGQILDYGPTCNGCLADLRRYESENSSSSNLSAVLI